MDQSIHYQPVGPERFDEALQLYNTQFLPYEPTLNSQNYVHELKEDRRALGVLDCLKENLSICAVDERTGKMIGLLLSSCTSLSSLPAVPPTFDECLESGCSKELAHIKVLLDEVLDARQVMEQHKENKMLMLRAVCVHPDYKKMGIGRKLVKEGLDHGVKCGFSFAGVVCTSYFTQLIFDKEGFEKVKEIDYASYSFRGAHTFKNVDNIHKSVISYIKKL